MKYMDVIFGKPLASEEIEDQRLSKYKALAVFSSDALSSVAYATEEILRVLVLSSAAAMALSLPIAMAITVLIILLAASYWQTIHAYPNGGGAFTVASENLGIKAGLIAAAALIIDYVLTVAVSVTAGVRALVSAFPVCLPHTVLLSLCAVAFIAILNLRGIRESASAFAFPTYLFIGLILLLIGVGFFKIATHQWAPLHLHRWLALQADQTPLMILLILRAFSAGCTAMTGIECVANGVPVFEKPEPRNAAQTLVMLATLLIIMFVGITYFAHHLNLIPDDQQSILSQLGHAVFGNSLIYYALQAATLLILLLAANTAFAGFPRLASILASQYYLPKQLGNLGDRLSFSNGIIVLGALSALLIILFNGVTHALIPLYAVGVFTAFSLSQLGMVKHWWRLRTRGWMFKASINGLGFIATLMALSIIVESKFLEGAWIVVICVPVLLFVFHKIHHHYIAANQELSITVTEAKNYLQQIRGITPKVILPVLRIHRGTLAALNFALTISPDVIAVAVAVDATQVALLKSDWAELAAAIPLVILPSPYRSAVTPLKRYIFQQDLREPERGLCMVVLSQAIPLKWWQEMLHNQRTFLLKTVLTFNRKYRHKGRTRIFVDVPYQLNH